MTCSIYIPCLKLPILQLYRNLTSQANLIKGWSQSMFNNLELVLYMTLACYSSKKKLLKLKVKRFQ